MYWSYVLVVYWYNFSSILSPAKIALLSCTKMTERCHTNSVYHLACTIPQQETAYHLSLHVKHSRLPQTRHLTEVIVVGVLKLGVPKSRNLSNLGSFCRYVGQGSPPQIWGLNSPLWGRYEFFKFWPIFQRANHDLALSDIFSKIKSNFFVVF